MTVPMGMLELLPRFDANQEHCMPDEDQGLY